MFFLTIFLNLQHFPQIFKNIGFWFFSIYQFKKNGTKSDLSDTFKSKHSFISFIFGKILSLTEFDIFAWLKTFPHIPTLKIRFC